MSSENDRITAVCIPTRNRSEMLAACIESLSRQDYPLNIVELLVFDDASCPEEALKNRKVVEKARAAGFCRTEIIFSENNVKMLAGRQRLTEFSSEEAEYILFMDDDCELEKHTLRALADTAFSDKTIGGVGPRIVQYSHPEVVLHSALFVNRWTGRYKMVDSDVPLECDWLNTTCLLFNKKALVQGGGFDLTFEHTHEESNLCLRIKSKGYRIMYQPFARAFHKLEPWALRRDRFFHLYRNKFWMIRKNFSGLRKLTALAGHFLGGTPKYLLESLHSNRGMNFNELLIILRAVWHGVAEHLDRGPEGHSGSAQEGNNAVVLYVIDGLEYGGGECAFEQLATSICEKGFKPVVCASSQGRFKNNIGQAGCRFFQLELTRRFSLVSVFKLAELIRKLKPAIIHSQGLRAGFHSVFAAAFARGCRMVSTVAMPAWGYDVRSLNKVLYSIAERFVLRRMACVMTVSQSLKLGLVRRYGLPSGRVTVIYNGVDTLKYDPGRYDRRLARKELGLGEISFVCGFIGRFVFQKGLEYLLDAAAIVLKEEKDVFFALAGEGPLKPYIMEKSVRLGIAEKCVFFPFQKDSGMFFSAVDAAVLPSVIEGFPIANLEAMSMAKPVVSTRIEGVAEQIEDGKTGLLVPPADSKALASAILRLAREPQLALSLGETARISVIEKFRDRQFVDKTIAVYDRLISN